MRDKGMAWTALFTLACALVLGPGPAAAAEPSTPWVDPGWRRTRAAYDVTFEADGLSRSSFAFEFKAVDDKGARAIAQQSFPYDSYFEDLTFEDLVTVKPDGRVIPIDARAVGDQPRSTDATAPYFDERRSKLVAFPDVAAGDSIRGRAVTVAKRARFPGEFEAYWSEARDRPPDLMSVTVSGPASRPLQVGGQGVRLTQERQGDRTIVRAEFIHATPQSTSDPDEFDQAPRLEVSTFANYAAFAQAVDARNAPMAKPTQDIGTLALQLAGGAKTKRDQVERTHNWVVQNVRYVGIGVEDGGWTARPASETLAVRYGDCKAHAVLLKALLAAQGIEAHLVLVNSRPRYRLTDVATANFDHAIVYVPSLDIYLDPTASAFAFGSLPPPLHGKPVLDVDRGTVGVIPPMKADDLLIEVRTDYTLHPDGHRSATSAVVGTGVGAVLTRSTAARLEREDGARQAREALERAGLTGSGSYAFPNPRGAAHQYAISAPFDVTSILDPGGRHQVRMLPLTSPLPHLSSLLTSERTDYACLPLTLRDEASLLLPPGINVSRRPGRFVHEVPLSGRTAYGEVTGRVRAIHEGSLDGRTVRTRSTFEVSFDAAVCPRAFAAEVRAALAKFDGFQRDAIGLTSKPVRRVIEGGSAYARGLAAYDDRRYELALVYWMPLAEAGDADAQYRVGLLHRDGLGVSRDAAYAHSWFTRAAEAGEPDAQRALARQFEMGLGTVANVEQAARWYGRAAETGSAEAMSELAHLYATGSGSHFADAVALYRKAAEAGVANANGAVGFMYATGRGVERDYGLAAQWYRKGVERGEAYAQMQLGYLYAEGLGVAKDQAAALLWTRKAAEQGDTVAEYNLGWIYENGLGVPKRLEDALVWYQRAAAKGYSTAQQRVDALASKPRRGGLLSQAYRWLSSMGSL